MSYVKSFGWVHSGVRGPQQVKLWHFLEVDFISENGSLELFGVISINLAPRWVYDQVAQFDMLFGH